LDIRPAELTNAPMALADLSSEDLGERLLNASSQHEQVVLLGEFLRARIGRARRADPIVTASLQLMARRIQSMRVPQLLKYLNLSERQFERRFMQAIGVSPHQYIRIVRFQEVLRRLKAMQFDRLSDVAYDLNYTDQSHFIKEVKDLSGYIPTRLFEIVRTCVDFPGGLIQARAVSDRNLITAAPRGNSVRRRMSRRDMAD
jgi:AraC-like DNA-binding protein